jgi:ubiquinone/menaquinone biosynthesis C-methylase UbiE
MTHREDQKRVVARSYDTIAERYADWATGVRQEERARYTDILIRALPRGSDLLELGCGSASSTTQALAHHFRLTGVDISPRTIELARIALPEATLIAADMTTVEFPPRSFDAVAAFYSIIHVPRHELGSLFRRVFAWLRPGGSFVATMNGSDTAGCFEDDWLGAPMFWSGYGSATTRRLVEAAGFTIESFTLETAHEDGKPASFWWLVARSPLRQADA